MQKSLIKVYFGGAITSRIMMFLNSTALRRKLEYFKTMMVVYHLYMGLFSEITG